MPPITDVNQKREMKLFRESRLALRELRIEVENKRKTLKEDSLRRGKAIDGIANVFKALVVPIEEYLEEQEKFAERFEAQRIAELGAKRFDMLSEYGDATCFSNLGTMDDGAFSVLLDNMRLAKEAREAAAKKIEQERIEREAAEAAEQARQKELARLEAIRIEEERQKREAELKAAKEKAEKELAAQKAKAKKEREAAEALAKAERERHEAEQREMEARAAEEKRIAQDKADREKRALEQKAKEMREAAEKEKEAREAMERQLAEQKAAQEAKEKAEAAARKKAENAPNKAKLQAFAESLRAIKVPTLTADCSEVQTEIESALQDLFILVQRSASKL